MPTRYAQVVVDLLHARPSPGEAVRIARTARGWSQAELGRRCRYSAGQVSRWETGRVALRDVGLLHTLARVLELPAEVFGLTAAAPTGDVPGRREAPRLAPVPSPASEEAVIAPVHRRVFLRAAALTGGTLAFPTAADAATHNAVAVDPALVLRERLHELLLGTTAATSTPPVGVDRLARLATAARDRFAASDYLALAEQLPALVDAAEATAASRPDPAAARALATAYALTCRALIKLEVSGLEWVAADRAQRAAREGEDPLLLAEARRLIASAVRRTGDHDRAQALTLAAADDLAATTRPGHLVMLSSLYCSASYAAARAGHRADAVDLLAQGAEAVDRLGEDPRRPGALANLVSHRVSAAHLLGDAGTALAHANSLPLSAFPTAERRGRVLVDAASAYMMWGKPDMAYRTLLTAERFAPGEVRTRTAVRELVSDLLASSRRAAMPGLDGLAVRVHAVA
ncbi:MULTISPECIES: helix-turn-helix transcriptional regulator [Actinosynnema]|uniref:helix-turn-helix domain-containing protein n=1 Tax=Actinosynnema TaxID=40566 RepID=UPI0020A447D9|nr:helix-turn-helix transcriptional regulator [Actinosynnema pretiosum]MCP2095572.1 Helix-turn-helix domain-containing protein [Actinosynnema pretiosum]